MAPASAEVRQPTGKWNAAPAGNECLLTRPFGTADNPLFLAFAKAPMWPGFTIIVLRHSGNADFRHGPASVTFAGAATIGGRFDARLLKVSPRAGLKVKTMRRIWIGADEGQISPTMTSVAIEARGEINETFALPDFVSGLQSLEECTIKLGERWGYPAEEQHRIANPPKPVESLNSLFLPKDYPTSALREQAMGRVRIKVPVSASGEATGCEVVAGSGNADLDATTCRIILTRARFEPATDINEKPVRSVFVETIQWLLM
jgi:TonB family protein